MSEIFGRHPSDQCKAFNHLISHIHRKFHHFVMDNLYHCGFMERSAIAIGERSSEIGTTIDLLLLITTSCARIDLEMALEDRSGAQRWPNDLLQWMEVHTQTFNQMEPHDNGHFIYIY